MQQPLPSAQRPLVVLVHGLFMRPFVMRWLARQLTSAGHEVRCFGYDTLRASLQMNTDQLVEFVNRMSPGSRPIVLVGHSMGGLVSWAATQRLPSSKVAGLVLMGSPVRGSQAARRLRSLCAGRPWLAVTLHDWMAQPQFRAMSTPVFTLAGTRAAGMGRLLCGFDEPNDGTVSVAETVVQSARQSCRLPVSHTGMLFSQAVADQVCRWLDELSEGTA